MNLISRVLHKWAVTARRRRLGNGFVHCMICGKELNIAVKTFLARVYAGAPMDFPVCSDCSVLIQEAEVDDAAKIVSPKK